MNRRPSSRILLTLGAFSGALIAALLVTGSAFAITGCRSDPLVTLSNGTSVRLVAEIGTSADNVNEVDYTLHIPQGLSVVSVQYDGLLNENLTWVADKPP